MILFCLLVSFVTFSIYTILSIKAYTCARGKIAKVLVILSLGAIMTLVFTTAMLCMMVMGSLEEAMYITYHKVDVCRTENIYLGVLCNNSTWVVNIGVNKSLFGADHLYTTCVSGNRTININKILGYMYLFRYKCYYDRYFDAVRCYPIW